MPVFPLPLLIRLSADDAAPVVAWWEALSDADRGELRVLWDYRGDDCRFNLAASDDVPAWHRLPLVGAEFTDESEPGDDWRPEWFDYLLSNLDQWTTGAPRPRTFFIGCTAHPAARAVLRLGFIPADFTCPLASAECPMRRLLDREPGRSVRLVRPGDGLTPRA